MQDGQFSNTPFQEQLANSNYRPPNKPSLQVFAESGTEPEVADPALLLQQFQNRINNTPDYKLGAQSPVTFSPSEVDVTGRYNWQRIGADNEDLYGQGQSWGDKALNGLLKGLNLAGTTFLQGTVGLVVGLGNVISGNGANSFYNNDFSNAIERWNKNTENYLPNYYTKKERDAAWYESSNLFTANFLFDKFIKNLGFSIGAIYSGAAVTKALKLVPAINSLFTGEKATAALSQIERQLAIVPAAERGATTANILRTASEAVISSKKFGTAAERLLVGTLGAATEGGIEALQGLNEYRNNLINEYTASTGMAPQGEALERINNYAENLGDARFLMNMALLTATNYVMLPKILGSSYKTSKGLANQEVSNVARTADGVWATTLSQAPKGVKALSKAKNIAGLFFSPTEGFEEISQYSIERGVQDYYNKAYRGEGRNWLSSISQGYQEAISSDEGMEQFLIGAFSGGLQQSGIVSTKGFGKSGNIKERGWTGTGGEIGKATTDFLSQLNDPNRQAKFKADAWLKDMAAASARGINLQLEGEAFIRQGDVLEAKDNEFDYLHNYLTPRIKHGRYDLIVDDIAQFRQQGSTEQGLEELKQQNIANENDTVATFSQRINNFAAHAENVNSLYQSLNLTYGGLINKETGKKIYTDAVIDKMVYAASKVADYDQRIPELSKELMSNGIVVQPAISDTTSEAPTGESVREAIKQIDDLSIIDTKKDELKEALRDVLELSSRRKGFLEEYKALKTNPTAFQATPTETVTEPAAPKQKITLKTKDGDEELEIGTEYYLGSVTEKDKDGNDVYRFPQITILGENEDGTIKIKSSTGVIKDVSKSVLEDYKLGRVDNLQNNKKAKFYFDHINDVFEFNFGKGKKQRGRLQFSPKSGILNFVYRDKKGKTRFVEVTGDQFIPKKGFSQPLIKSIRTLTPAQQKSLEEMAAEKDARTQAKREARIGIVTSLINDAYNRLASINSKLKDKYQDLEGIEKKLSEIELKIRRGELTKKQNFKATTKAAIRQANILSGMRNVIVDEIRALETEQEETEFNITYFEDLGQNIDELPTDSNDFLEEINDQVLDLTILHEETGKQINALSSILNNVEKALKNSVDFALNLIKKFEAKYPGLPIAPTALQQFLNKDLEFKGTWPDYQSYLSANPNLLDDLREFDRELAEIDELDVIPNERSIEELRNDIKELQDKLTSYDKQIAAKQAILDKFEQIAKEYKTKEEAKKRYAADKALHDALFKAQSVLQQEPADDTPLDGVDKLEKADKEATKKQDLVTYPISTAFTTREIDPTFESKPHLLREEAFLNNYAAGNLTDNRGNDITPEVRVLVVHKGNQEALGLNGLVELRNPNEATQASTILYVYIKKGEGVFEIIDETGKTICEYDADFTTKSPVDLNNVVTSVAKTSSSISQKADNYTNKEKLDVKAVEKAWEEERTKLLSSTNTVLSIAGVSRGIKQITNTSDKNPIVPTLTKEAKPGMIKISTTDVISTPNQSVFYKAGRPYLQIGDNITFINNRNLNKNEADTIFLVLKEVATKFQQSILDGQPQLDKPLVDWLNSVIYWYSPKPDQKPHNQQIYIKNGQLYISGVNTEIYFNPEQLEANREPIINTFLQGNQAGQGTYHHVSHRALTQEGPYISYYTEDGKTLKTKSYPSYQDYLLENQVVSTNVRPQISPTDSNIRGRYAIIDIDLNLPKPEEKKPAPKKPQAAVDKKADIEKLEKEKQKILKPLIEEKEQIEKEIEEIEKDSKSSKTNSQEIESLKEKIKDLRNTDGTIPENKLNEFRSLRKQIQFLESDILHNINKAINEFISDNNLTEKDKKLIYALAEIRDNFQEVIDEFNEKRNSNYTLSEIMTFFGSSFNLQESIETETETDNKKAHEYENKLLEGNGFKANEDYTADELNDFVQKHGSKQVKFIWNLIKAVAQKLGVTTRFMLQGNSKIPVGAAGHYLNGKIENRASLFSHPESAARIIVHELVHGVTTYILKAVEQNNTKILSKLTTRQLKAVEKLNALFDELKKDKEFDDTYGTKNTHELLAELTNENFVDKLKSKNVFEKILEAIFEIFNIPFNAYNESVKILEDLISNPLEDNRYEGSLGEGYSLYSKSESTKLQQLKQKLAEVNKKINEVTKRFNAQIAQKQAELKALEQQPTSNQSEIEAKKADIERRRQEELFTPIEKNTNDITEQVYLSNEEGRKELVNIIKYLAEGHSKKSTAQLFNTSESDIQKIRNYLSIPSRTTGSTYAGQVGTDEEIKEAENKFKEWKEKIDKINAKYDAELAALAPTGRKKNVWDDVAASLSVEETGEEKPAPKTESKPAPASGRKRNMWDDLAESMEEADDKLNDLKSQGFTGDVTNDDEDEYRRLSEKDSKNVKVENWSAVEAWLAKNLPNVPVQRVKHLLQMTGGGWAWGKFGKAGITLYENAKEGTGYHEAFEAVWALFTTLEEKQAVFSTLRNRKGKFLDVISGQTISYAKASNTALKEVLADEFAEYVQNNGAASEKMKGESWIIRLFRGLYDLLKGLIDPSEKNINQLFKHINTGYYSTRPVNLVRQVATLNEENTKKIDQLRETRDSKIINLLDSDISINFATNKEIVDSDDPIENKRILDELKNEFKSLEELIACL